LNGPQFLRGGFLEKPLEVEDGKMAVPTGPGLGVEIDEERVREGRL
jgi:muconate cycloisomerase